MREQNAVIESTSLQLDREVFLSAWLHLDYGNGAHQGFGGYVLGGTPEAKAGDHKSQPNLAAEWIVSILLVAGVSKWSDLPGKTIRVRREGSEGDWSGDVIAIGHIVKDLWFNPKEAVAALGEHPQ